MVSRAGCVEERKGRGTAPLLEVIEVKGVGFIREPVQLAMQRRTN